MISLLLAFGPYTSPIWVGRFDPDVRALIGPHDEAETTAIRQDLKLRDGDGSLYWVLATVLPGFRQFRFPSKLLSFTALAVAGLAGLGWDEARSGRARRVLRLALMVFAAQFRPAGYGPHTAGALIEALSKQGALSIRPSGHLTRQGPFESRSNRSHTRPSSRAAFIFLLSKTRCVGGQEGYGALILVVLTLDLATANARLVLTVPQEDFVTKPEVLERIEEAERLNPAPGPFRIHREPIWNPFSWRFEPSTERVRDMFRWERSTIQPKYGLSYGVEYTRTLGVAELYDYEWFFATFTVTHVEGRTYDWRAPW